MFNKELLRGVLLFAGADTLDEGAEALAGSKVSFLVVLAEEFMTLEIIIDQSKGGIARAVVLV